MAELMVVNVGLALVNTALALALGAIYWRNHRELRTPFTLGLLVFALFFVVHNAVLAYHILTMMATFTTQAEAFLLLEGVLQLVGMGSLVYVTMR